MSGVCCVLQDAKADEEAQMMLGASASTGDNASGESVEMQVSDCAHSYAPA